MEVPLNRHVLIGFSSINNPFWGTNICGNLHSHGGSPIAGWLSMENPNLKWMIWGYPYFRKPPYMIIYDHI
jgi:hypothetical protein